MLSYTLTARDMRNAAVAQDTFAQAWRDCHRTRESVTVLFWDALTEPTQPSWVLRTYRFTDGAVSCTDDRPL